MSKILSVLFLLSIIFAMSTDATQELCEQKRLIPTVLSICGAPCGNFKALQSMCHEKKLLSDVQVKSACCP
ncbi:hypothetical protein CRE_30149 [Caenorhabditis remanei]|uniref:Uncharacterized protein n=1 Tax=Caenorhabditis remanei TaxID=31234 RepID=E3NAJ3_CAERE|nr:hypothetical protein CRE_30149 [Caenorhabditis remanei]